MDTLLDQTREQLDASRRECGGLHGEVAMRLKEIQALQGELRVTKRELGDRLHELALLQGREHEYVQQVAAMEVGGGSLATAGMAGVPALPCCSNGGQHRLACCLVAGACAVANLGGKIGLAWCEQVPLMQATRLGMQLRRHHRQQLSMVSACRPFPASPSW